MSLVPPLFYEYVGCVLTDVFSCSEPLDGGSVPFSAGGRSCLRSWSLRRIGPSQGCLLLELTTTSEVLRDFCLLLSSVVVTICYGLDPEIFCMSINK